MGLGTSLMAQKISGQRKLSRQAYYKLKFGRAVVSHIELNLQCCPLTSLCRHSGSRVPLAHGVEQLLPEARPNAIIKMSGPPFIRSKEPPDVDSICIL